MSSKLSRLLLLLTFASLTWLFWIIRLGLQPALWLPSFGLVITYCGVVWITSLLFVNSGSTFVYPFVTIAVGSSIVGAAYVRLNPNIDASVWHDGAWPLAQWAIASTLSVAPVLLTQAIRRKLHKQ